MRSVLGGPRLLLRRLREISAEPVNAQTRLDKIVVQIAANMVAEVCSVYVLRADQRLELYATEGLNREAVHLTTLKAGEGLVGLIAQSAEPLALSEAQEHPAFLYRPETGEEIYHSFLGVPILRGGNTVGVLVVQNKVRRTYSEEEVEALQTTAMLLAEMIASGELQSIAKSAELLALNGPVSLRGAPISDGVGLGYALLHEPRVVIKSLLAEDVPGELQRLDTAIEAMRSSIDELVAHGDRMGAGEHREVLEAVRMVANDRGWLRRLREAVMTGLTAEAAVERVQNDARARMQRQTDPYLRDRLHDLDDIANRLLHQLTGQSYVADRDSVPDNAIIVARNMGPAALLDYDREKLRGLVLEEGGPASHVAIVARALGIAAVGLVPNITGIVEPNDPIIIDGSTGDLHVRPQQDVRSAYGEKARLRARRQEQYAALRDIASVTKDGVEIALHMNAGLTVDVPFVRDTGARSIGLFRTELQFMLANRFPRMKDQYLFYKTVLDAVPDRPVTFRTLDIGSDKILPYMATIEEENPALGWRAIRIGLDRPGLLRMQLRAMLKAAGGRDLRIMFPMVANVAEFDLAKAIALRELDLIRRHGHATPTTLDLGAMVEVPALLWELDQLAEHADFLSVGSNDLVQYLYAADRDNTRVAKRYDNLSVPVLRALKTILEAGAKAGKPVTLCGEMGGRPLEAMALLALGYRSLSMSPSSIGPVKAMILSLDMEQATAFLASLMANNDGQPSLRENLRQFASAQGVAL
ncbi:phosphoenolpyruvate--protein phosphotransferase [Methylocystis heyeri]|uniref:phosphoenolpyruvate--protein phosphotransferase n=1 Tax=Methylocystis heyeri TaxID=391905 RepID=A0A6B8KFM0_9HYPH|nr:phosphoenolpyruvate--protein phosphotransferase [Methylocystis heyeri]QGM45293.1 phosphoenolpyruvate--protein phosphotransferase [Methylocystis heyeri]